MTGCMQTLTSAISTWSHFFVSMFCCHRIPDNITTAQKEAGVLKQTLAKGTELHLHEVRIRHCSLRRPLQRFDVCCGPAGGSQGFLIQFMQGSDLGYCCSIYVCCSDCSICDTTWQVGLLALFAGELYAWFVVGEIVGRGGSLVDYEV